MYYDKEGKEISALTWAALSDLDDYKILKQDKVENYRISTIWKGVELDDLFETAIFCEDEDDYLHLVVTSSKSASEALESHKIAIDSCVESAEFEESCSLSEKIDANFDLQNDVNEVVKQRLDALTSIVKKIELNISLLCIAANRPK